jgi:hypothetical protein
MIALHVLTVVFLAQDPTLPSLVVQVSDGDVRELTLFVVDDDSAPHTVQLREQPTERSAALPRWPLPPTGASLTAAVDGVIITIDDAGAFSPLTPSSPAAPTKTRSTPSTTLPWPPPSLPVAGPRTLRLFVPTVVDGTSTPATLHGQGFVIAGAAMAFEGPLPTALLTWRDGEVIRRVPEVVFTTPATDACAPHVSIALEGPWTATSSIPACALGFAVSAVSRPIVAPSAGKSQQKEPEIRWSRSVLLMPVPSH